MSLLSLNDAPGYGIGATGGDVGAAEARLPGEVSQLAPLATTYHSQQAPQPLAYTQPQAGGSNISRFTHFVGGVFDSVGHIGIAAGEWLGHNIASLSTAIPRLGDALYHVPGEFFQAHALSAQSDQITGQMHTLNAEFRSGRITLSQYNEGMKSINQSFNDLSKQFNSWNNLTKINESNARQAVIDTAALLLTVFSGTIADGLVGIGAKAIGASELTPLTAKTVLDYVASQPADAVFNETESVLAKAITDKAFFNKLPSSAQQYVQRTTAEVASSAGNMTAKNIARASAVNLALKYPIYYNMFQSTGNQLYKELDQKKYGDAVRTTAFNAALLLSGGPIGWAIHGTGRVFGAISKATFDRTGFWDELSKYFAGGDSQHISSGFADAAQRIASSEINPFTNKAWKDGEKKAFFQTLSDSAATNVHATGGDQVAAAYRVANSLRANYNFDLTKRDPYDELISMFNHSQVHSEMDAWGRNLGLRLTPGRVDVRALKGVGNLITTNATTKEDMLANWELTKEINQGWAWAHSDSFDRQIQDLIGSGASPKQVRTAVKDIPAGMTPKGLDKKIPKSVLETWSRRGYAPIAPQKLEAPFVKGTGKFESRFVDEGLTTSRSLSRGVTTITKDDVFAKMVEPLPVAKPFGDLLVRAGLSPNASTQRVYQLMNANLATELTNMPQTRAILERSGRSFDDAQHAADLIQKKLSSYAKNPTRGKIMSNMPITDLRIMTNKDIQEALGATKSEALAIQHAISLASMKIPFAVRGLGDRVVDATLHFGPSGVLMRRYLRIQGALRFSWNPFYQELRVIPKTEYLTETQGGGVFRAMFQGRLREINSLREDLRTAGVFDQPGRAIDSVVQGEAVGAETDRNLSKKLLPMQERSIAALVDSQAQRMGMTGKEYIAAFPDQVRDTVQAIAQYDRHSDFLNSPLTRTLNIAFFPFRFEAKVAIATAKGLANTSLLTQVAVIKGLMGAHQWLNSPEGESWYSANADAIGIFKYITPLASFNEVFQSLLPGHDHSLGNFGELGGLPFGWIPQILDAEGMTHFNQVGTDAKTGQPFPSYVPQTLKGQAAIAIQDLIDALFSYPGATVGLPSKSSVSREAALGITQAKKGTDLKLTTPALSDLSKEKQAYATAISAQQQPGAAPPRQPSGTNVPVLNPNIIKETVPQPNYRKTPRKKESQFTPALLPGQTTLGQL